MTLNTARTIAVAMIFVGWLQPVWSQNAPPPTPPPTGPIVVRPPNQPFVPAPATVMTRDQMSQGMGAPTPVQYGPQPVQLPPRTASRQQVPLPPPRAPQAPFQLTPQQETDLHRVLRAWEERSQKVQTLTCEFKKWEYDETFGIRNQLDPKKVIPRESKGEIKYSAPDKGLYHVVETRMPVGEEAGQPKFQTSSDGGEHWVCDGQSIWEYDYQKKQLIERRLPPEMQGKAIQDGPLPFLFGAEADKLLARYWMRVVTPANVQSQVWIEAFPKNQIDAANFRRATVILDSTTLFPLAIEVHLPNGKSRHVHQLFNNVANANNGPLRFLKGDFSKPALPRGWTKVEDQPRAAAPPALGPANPPRS